MTTKIRGAEATDEAALWAILEPIFRAGETYCQPRDITRAAALRYWAATSHEVFIAEVDGRVLGTYFLCPNQDGGGSHVCNAGFATADAARGLGIARAMLEHALERSVAVGYRAMQFNFVIASNVRALAIWERYGFDIVGKLPKAFHSPTAGYIDAYVMYRDLTSRAA